MQIHTGNFAVHFFEFASECIRQQQGEQAAAGVVIVFWCPLGSAQAPHRPPIALMLSKWVPVQFKSPAAQSFAPGPRIPKYKLLLSALNFP